MSGHVVHNQLKITKHQCRMVLVFLKYLLVCYVRDPRESIAAGDEVQVQFVNYCY